MTRHVLFATLSGLIIGMLAPLPRYEALLTLATQLTALQLPGVPGGAAIDFWLLPMLGALAGLLAGRLALSGHTVSPDRRGLWAGLSTGAGMLIGVTLAFSGLLALIGSNPAVQEFVRMSEPHPEARLPVALIPWLGAAVGSLLGMVIGAECLLAAVFGGLFADLLHGRGIRRTERPAH